MKYCNDFIKINRTIEVSAGFTVVDGDDTLEDIASLDI